VSEAQQLSVRVYSIYCTNSKWRIQHIHMPQADSLALLVVQHTLTVYVIDSDRIGKLV
jgi:hypothetical protein